MLRGYYGKEPFDLRLTLLRMFHKIPLIITITLMGTLVFGGIYYIKNVLLWDEHLYALTLTYRVEYDVDVPKEVTKVCINDVSWNTYLQTDLFQDAVRHHLEEEVNSGDSADMELDDRELAEVMNATLASDVRVVSTTITTDDPQKTMRIARAVEAAMTHEFAEELREILDIRVIDRDDTAEEVIPDVRIGRAFVLSAVLSCFFVIVVLLLKELGDDSIWLPSVFQNRYGLKAVGTIESRTLRENMKYIFRRDDSERDIGKIAVCAVQDKVDSTEVLERLRQTCPGVVGAGWFAVSSPIVLPEICEELRGADGILLAVEAGSHEGRKLEYVLEYLTQQDCVGQKDGRPVIAAILWNADERLLRRYYGFDLKKKKGV